MCTVLVRFGGGGDWALTVAAVRDEFSLRPWDAPAAHWPDSPGVVGGRGRVAGGTWLAVDPGSPAVAALLNGVRLPMPADGVRPSRGSLVLAALAGTARLDAADLAGYDGFHLVLGTPDSVIVWSWDGKAVRRLELAPGNHIIVNDGVDTSDDPLVPHFEPLLAGLPDLTDDTLKDWTGLLAGDGLPGDDPRALIVAKDIEGQRYGSSSAALIAIGPAGARFDFTATPASPNWYRVL